MADSAARPDAAVRPPLATRILPVLLPGVALALAFSAALDLLGERAARRGAFPDYSAFSAGENGLAAFATFARESGVDLRLVETRSTMLPDVRGAAFVVVRPGAGGAGIDAEEATRIQEWVAAGNLLVLADDRPSALSRQLGFEIVTDGAPERIWRAADPSGPLAKGAPRVLGAGAAWIEPGHRRYETLALYAASDLVKAAYVAIGPEGHVLVLADPYPLTNAGLRESESSPNPGFASALVGLVGNRPVYLDEYHHGIVRSPSFASYLEGLGLGPFLLQLAALGALVLAAVRPRLGPPLDAGADPRREWSEHVAARADLHARLGHHAWSLEALAARLGALVAAEPGAVPPSSWRPLEAEVARAIAAKRLSGRRLLKLAQRIDAMERELEACRNEPRV